VVLSAIRCCGLPAPASLSANLVSPTSAVAKSTGVTQRTAPGNTMQLQDACLVQTLVTARSQHKLRRRRDECVDCWDAASWSRAR
jgi:hypothetical protein